MSWSAPNILLLDEPSNHLDIDSRQALVQAINEFDGAVIIISHDPNLIELCADRLWLVKDGTVTTASTAIWTITASSCWTTPAPRPAAKAPARRATGPHAEERRQAAHQRAVKRAQLAEQADRAGRAVG